jgi:Leucine-rich repeat (LRR) protein
LDLSSLGLSELPFIQDLKQLRSVILDNNNITKLDWFKNNSIQSLSLKNNKIAQFPLNYQLRELVKLNLEGNLLEVLDGLQNLTSLKYLNLSSIQSLRLTKLSSQQCYHKSLKILKLKAHNQGQVISFSPHWFPKLVELYLDGFELNKSCSELEFSEKLKKISMRKSYGNCETVLRESKLRELGYLFAEGKLT